MDRLERLAEDLLLLAQSGEGGLQVHLESLAIGDLFASTVARFTPSFADSGRSLEVEVVSSSGHARADRRLLQQALTNLVANAWEHGGGAVGLSVRDRGPMVELVVSDSGPGVDTVVRERVSERFVRGPASTGAGLGLSIVAAIAKAHGGTSGLRRSDGHTEAWLTVPRAS